ncbi:hypothetical protein T09_7163 [Trichinella sp. T9]|nr:hypothetical protein T09_6892 [Trichinella sp. T9]KRX53205.1 hypothetical protein T09_7163 [Trichinella sp. T9]
MPKYSLFVLTVKGVCDLERKICNISILKFQALGLFLLGPTFYLLIFDHAILLDRQIFVVLVFLEDASKRSHSQGVSLLNAFYYWSLTALLY